MWGWGDGWGGGWGSAGGVVMIVVMLAVLALIAVGIVFLVRGLGRHDYSGREHPPEWYREEPRQEMPPDSGPSRRALDTLEDRYARGEIDREEFLSRRQDLLGTGERRP